MISEDQLAAKEEQEKAAIESLSTNPNFMVPVVTSHDPAMPPNAASTNIDYKTFAKMDEDVEEDETGYTETETAIPEDLAALIPKEPNVSASPAVTKKPARTIDEDYDFDEDDE